MVSRDLIEKCVNIIASLYNQQNASAEVVYLMLKSNSSTYGELKKSILKLQSDIRYTAGLTQETYINCLNLLFDKEIAALTIQQVQP